MKARSLSVLIVCVLLHSGGLMYSRVDEGSVSPRACLPGEELGNLLSRLPGSNNAFISYIAKTGDLPPDFNSLPSRFDIGDPLVWEKDGAQFPVSASEWPERRLELLSLVETWLLGAAPPPPGNVTADVQSREISGGREEMKVILRFGPDQKAQLSVALNLPEKRSGPVPVFICDSERYLRWIEGAVREGFGYVITGLQDRGDESEAFAELFGDYDWSAFRRRGWSTSRVVDWLVTLPEVDGRHIYTGGHSRAAKSATVGAVFDERIAGVIASSPGSGGGSTPYRFIDQTYFGESAEVLTRMFPDWVHPRVRMFSGREDRLPADSHFLYALLAPRPLLMAVGTEDQVENPWAVEQVYDAVNPVYDLLDGEGNLLLYYRPGGHSINDSVTFETFSAFLLAATRDDGSLASVVKHKRLYPWDFSSWAASQPAVDLDSFPSRATPRVRTPAPTEKAMDSVIDRNAVEERINWILGDGPRYKAKAVAFSEGDPSELADVLQRYRAMEHVGASRLGIVDGSEWDTSVQPVSFGDGITGYFYGGANVDSMPIVIWLGPFQPALGFVSGAYRVSPPTPAVFVEAGIPLLSFDPIGTGARKEERQRFYEENPDWSLMGKMVQDARHAIDAALWFSGDTEKRVYLYGYAMGGMVALVTAALDDRVHGVASVAGFTPFRTDVPDKRTGGIRRFSHLFGWIPRLGFFLGNEDRIPVDFDEMLFAIAPRRTLIIAPSLDRYAAFEEVFAAVENARDAHAAHGDGTAIELKTFYDENRLSSEMQRAVVDWIYMEPPAMPDRSGIVVAASAHDGNKPENTLDGNFNTRWSALGEGQWIRYDFGRERTLSGVMISWFASSDRSSRFSVSVSNDGERWHKVFDGASDPKNPRLLQKFRFENVVAARYVKIIGKGNNLNKWNSIHQTAFLFE